MHLPTVAFVTRASLEILTPAVRSWTNPPVPASNVAPTLPAHCLPVFLNVSAVKATPETPTAVATIWMSVLPMSAASMLFASTHPEATTADVSLTLSETRLRLARPSPRKRSMTSATPSSAVPMLSATLASASALQDLKATIQMIQRLAAQLFPSVLMTPTAATMKSAL